MSTNLTAARFTSRSRVLPLLLSASAMLGIALVVTAPAPAATHAVSGTQTVINEDAGTYRMHGGLVGKWKITSFEELGTAPIYRAKGTEKFTGCLAHGKRSCAGRPSGTLSFRFRYWAEYTAEGELVWGSCWHKIVGGTGDFAGARGVLTFVDTPTADGVKTAYVGNVTLKGSKSGGNARLGRRAPGHGCGAA